MFHVELRQFPHTARAFNLTRERLHSQIVIPWVRGDMVEVDLQKFAPERAKLKIYEGPELQTGDMGMGRGWQNVMRRGEDVTERELRAAASALPAVPEAQAPAASAGPRAESIDHIDLVVSSLERSLVFYGGLLGPLGFTRWSTITGERGERVVYLGREGSHFAIALCMLDQSSALARGDAFDHCFIRGPKSSANIVANARPSPSATAATQSGMAVRSAAAATATVIGTRTKGSSNVKDRASRQSAWASGMACASRASTVRRSDSVNVINVS